MLFKWALNLGPQSLGSDVVLSEPLRPVVTFFRNILLLDVFLFSRGEASDSNIAIIANFVCF